MEHESKLDGPSLSPAARFWATVMVLLCSIGAVEFLFRDDFEIHIRLLLMTVPPVLFALAGKRPVVWMRTIAEIWHFRR